MELIWTGGWRNEDLPGLDVKRSGTRREELLLLKSWNSCGVPPGDSGLGSVEVTEMLMMPKKTKTNADLLRALPQLFPGD